MQTPNRLALRAALVFAVASLSACNCGEPVTTSDGGSDGHAIDCVDGDGDGYGTGSACLGPDCDDGNAAVFPTANETCNGADDNCNGMVDEGLADLTCGVGACARTVTACIDGMPQACTPGTPGTETCNGLDDDCNGMADDGPAGQAMTCTTGQPGVCEAGLTQCSDAGIVCVPQLTASPEACNGLDDNCDGTSDEGNPDGGVACDTGLLGVCQSGTSLCADGGIACVQLAQAQPESCNGLDDDCNGNADEGNPDSGVACDTGLLGACANGATTCADGGIACVQLVFPVSESCNGADDNCDGTVDEGNPGGGVACDTGVPGVCAPGLTACMNGALSCVAASTAMPEACNGLDDNCDGVVDDGDPDGGVACVTGLLGECANGATTCQMASIVCAQTVQPIAEACNGKDDNCDGTPDEGNPDSGVACDTGLLGVCAAGATQCNDGGIDCVQLTAATVESCDGLDNDCNGTADEGNPGGGVACTTGLQGVCSPGTTACANGALACNQNVQPSAETCDGLDNNCDGTTDEGNPGGGANCNSGQQGVCAAGTMTCTNGALGCAQNVQPSAETCDGLDNNCDGQTDEGNPGGGVACNTGLLGVCAVGVTACSSGAIVCTPVAMPTAEVCDGLDNNCDGQVDEGNPGSGNACNTGLPGVCSAGVTACTNGAIACNQAVMPSPETCDGQDNDCDGAVDNGNPGGGASCVSGQPGVCAPGTTACSGGAIVCNSNVSPSAEVCDGLDNDCNGLVDNGNPGGGLACNTGQQGICAAGTTACTGGAISCNPNSNPTAETCNSLDDNCNGLVDDSATAPPDGNPNSCASAGSRVVTVPAGGLANLSGYIDGSGDDYFVVNFTGVGGPGTYYRPTINFVSNPATQFKLFVYSSCGVTANGCGGPLDTWQMSYPTNPNSCQSFGNCSDLTPRLTSVIVRVVRVGGAPYYCTPYTVRMANQ